MRGRVKDDRIYVCFSPQDCYFALPRTCLPTSDDSPQPQPQTDKLLQLLIPSFKTERLLMTIFNITSSLQHPHSAKEKTVTLSIM